MEGALDTFKKYSVTEDIDVCFFSVLSNAYALYVYVPWNT